MGESTVISWTGKTWNPWVGCLKVSPGCDNCYMYRDRRRYGQDGAAIRRTAPATFNAPTKWPRSLIFTCSWSDFFLAQADDWRPEAWGIIERTPQHTYQILTKRATRMLSWSQEHGWPDHCWAGVSVESGKYLHRRDVLRQVPAQHRFLSLEPLLEDLGELNLEGIGAVIVGGESVPGFRPMGLEWTKDVRDQCIAAGVFFHFKQSAGPRSGQGRLLDGRLWDGWPQTNGVATVGINDHE
jgi:protein gp37